MPPLPDIRAKLRPFEPAAFAKAYSEKKLKDITRGGCAAFGKAATRFEGGSYAYRSYPDIDEFFAEQRAK